jgi:hypothetical protein
MSYEFSAAIETEPADAYEQPQWMVPVELAEIDSEPSRWQRMRIGLGKLATVGSIITGMGVLAPAVAHAEEPTCYGDYCTGQYADVAHCDEDAHTIAEAVISRPGLGVGIEIKDVSVGYGNTDPNEVARLELRSSDRCGTVWGKLNAKSGDRLDYWGIMNVGVQQDGGFAQDRNVDGNWIGAPAAESFSPMVYGRDRDYRAMVDVKNWGIPTTLGTYWVEGPK